jgi:PEP-CTERM motif
MATLIQKFILATAVVASAGALFPAHAGTLQSATIGGSAPSDYLIYGANATNTFLVPNNAANLQTALSGNSSNPTGNVELAASSEKTGFDFTKNTTLNGTLGGKALSISSLTKSDWLSTVNGTTTTFGQSWFNQALSSNGFGTLVGTSTANSLFSIFQGNGGFERFSDPNISYVNQNDTTGKISIGLAGHYSANSLFTQSIDSYLAKTTGLSTATKLQLAGMKTTLASKPIQASEVFKYTYNGQTNYGYSFLATQSGLVEKSDGISHSGNYEVVFQGIAPPKKVPEPSVVLSLLGLAGVAAVRRRQGQAAE